ncbi:MAG TPA: tubulin-like doman-containing protein [Pirellulaceae bacterium]|nr:tubulin-like doman-containing protein [Pirellulaceae bacterium]
MAQNKSMNPERSMEPIPGYRLYERVGAGGYGEVWSAEAPGELVKAVKFVYGYLNEERASRELKALNRIKGVRHPFILSLERIEIVDGHLIIVTELADCSLKDRFEVCHQTGQAGIPRDELLSHLRDAADALDYMNEHHGLQHLDVKPENLLLVGGRIKVADFGLVKDMEETSASMMGGLTPIYAPPEVFDGRPSRRSDQYSLAIVYQEMLTGVLPFPGKTAAQLAAQHLSAQPRLNNLSPEDREVIAKALAKNPDDRFANCRELVDTLIRGKRAEGRKDAPAPAAAPAPSLGAFGLPVPGVMKTDVGSPGSTPAAGMNATEIRTGGPRTPGDMLRDADIANHTALLAAQGREAEAEARLRPSTAFTPSSRTQTDEDLRQSLVGGVQPDRSALWSAPDEEREVVDLPPLAVDVSQWKPVPTFYVGLGATAGRTLQRLRRKLEDRYQGQRATLFPMCFVDTDQREVMRATHGDDGAPLSPHETIAIPLRKSQDYRIESNKHLEWLSRRWLYNIPRSQQTEGVRPLGRLALVDHGDVVRRHFRAQLQSFLKATAPSAGGERQPVRIVVLASISGATGSGAVLDVAFLLRQLLEDQKATGDVMLVLAHNTCRQAAAQQLAQVNAYVTLTELNQCLRAGGVYPGDQSLKVDPRSGTSAGIQTAYLFHLGNELSNEQYEAGCEQMAEYLFLDAGTPAGGYLAACRSQPPVERDTCPGEFLLRSFGLCRVGFSGDDLLEKKVDQLCRSVVRRWLGEPKRAEGKQSIRLLSPLAANSRQEAADRDAAIDARAAQMAQGSGLDNDTFLRHAYQAAEKELGTDALSYFRKLMWGVARSRGEGPYPVDQCLAALDNLFGPRKVEVSVAALKNAPLPMALTERIKGLIVQIGGVLQVNMVTLADEPSLRVYGAQRIVKWSAAHLKTLAEKFHEMRNQVLQQMAQSEQQLLQAAGIDARGRAKASKTPSHVLEGMLVQYAQVRLMMLAAEAAGQLALGAQGFVTAGGDKLAELAREVKCMTAYFGKEDESDDVDQPLFESDPLAGLRQGVVESLAEQIDSLATDLDQQVCTSVFQTNGFRRTILQGGQARDELINLLKRDARRVLLAQVQTADIAAMVMGPQQGSGDGSPVQQLTAEARPWLECAGGQRRMMCVVPEASQSGCNAETMNALVGPSVFKESPALIGDTSSDLVFCFELSDIAISHAAAAIIDHRPDYADLAYRLHSRTDIVWQPLPPR